MSRRTLRLLAATFTLGLLGGLAPLAASPAAAEEHDLSVTATMPANLKVGDLFSLSFTPKVGGQALPDGIAYHVTFEVPEGLEIFNTWQLDNPNWSCQVSGRFVSCYGFGAWVRRVQLLAAAPGTHDIELTITGAEGTTDPVPDPTSNTTVASTTVVASVKDMAIEPMQWSGTAGMPYTVMVVLDHDPLPAGDPEWNVGATFTIDLPDELLPTDVEFDPWFDPLPQPIDGPYFEDGSCAIAGQTVTCSDMTHPGSNRSVLVHVLPLEAGTFPITATFTPGPHQSEPIPDPRPNTVTWDALIFPGQNGAIGGVVTGGAAPRAGVVVSAFAPGAPTPAATATTSANGAYFLSNLTPGNYELLFTPPTGSPFDPQWKRADGVATTRSAATPIVVNSLGGTISVPMNLEDFDLSRTDLGASAPYFEGPDPMVVAGEQTTLLFAPGSRVRRVDGQPNVVPETTTFAVTVPNDVTVMSAFPRWGAGGQPGGADASCTTTAHAVECTLSSVAFPEVAVNVVPSVAGSFDVVTTHTSTTPENVPDVSPNTVTSSVDVIANVGSLSGTLRIAGTNAPVRDAFVLAYLPTDGYFPSSTNAWAITDTNGNFSFDDLPAGTYKIAVAPAPTSGVSGRWLTNATSRATATSYDVGPFDNGLTGTHTLPSSTRVTGTITGPSGAVDDARVVAYAATDRYAGSYETRTAGDGTYTFTGLPAGTYKLRIVAPTGSGLTDQWYDNTTSRTTATPLTADGTTLTGIDATLTP